MLAETTDTLFEGWEVDEVSDGLPKAIELIKKTREYLDYIEEHINNVQKAWAEIQAKCKDMRFVYDDFVFYSIDQDVKKHDISKLGVHEFVQYRRQFYTASSESGYVAKVEFDDAWIHHWKNNPHHWENWTTTPQQQPYGEEINIVGMIIDWTAMGYKLGDTAQSFYENKKDSINIDEDTEKFMYEIFDRLAIDSTEGGGDEE